MQLKFCPYSQINVIAFTDRLIEVKGERNGHFIQEALTDQLNTP